MIPPRSGPSLGRAARAAPDPSPAQPLLVGPVRSDAWGRAALAETAGSVPGLLARAQSSARGRRPTSCLASKDDSDDSPLLPAPHTAQAVCVRHTYTHTHFLPPIPPRQHCSSRAGPRLLGAGKARVMRAEALPVSAHLGEPVSASLEGRAEARVSRGVTAATGRRRDRVGHGGDAPAPLGGKGAPRRLACGKT